MIEIPTRIYWIVVPIGGFSTVITSFRCVKDVMFLTL